MDAPWNVKLYNDKHAFVHEHGKELVDLLDPKPGESILDLGCGAGQLTSQIASAGATVIGVDSSPHMVQAAIRSYPKIEFRQMDACSLDFDKPFDAIFSNAALHWIRDQKKVTAMMHLHLKEGGRLVVEFGGKGNVGQIRKALNDCFRQRGMFSHAEPKRWYFPSIGEYTRLLESAGFEVNVAQLFDRPTVLASEQSGIKDWLAMFAKDYFIGIDPAEADKIMREVQETVRPALFHEGKWYADYRRIRVMARKLL
jgi:trans-aconitate methyltransferase